MSPIAVIGCGNLARGDDGAGCEVVAELRRGALGREPRVQLLDAGTDGMAVMFAARGCSTLILVDAARTGSTPGAIFEVPGGELENPAPPSHTLHDFRWDHALHAGRRMYREAFPEDVVVLLVEAGSTAFGIGLTAPVAGAVPKIAERVEQLVGLRLREAA